MKDSLTRSIDTMPQLLSCVRIGPLAVATLLTGIVVGCGASAEDARGVRVPVNGFVTLDGETLKAGRIVFITDQGDGEVKASATVTEGTFGFTADNGPLEGEARVEIYPVEMELEELEAIRAGDNRKKIDITPTDIPAQYNVRSTLTASVSADGLQNLYTFDLTSKN